MVTDISGLAPTSTDTSSLNVYVQLQLVLAQTAENQQALVEQGVAEQAAANQSIEDMMAINTLLNSAIAGQTDATANGYLTAEQMTDLVNYCASAQIELPGIVEYSTNSDGTGQYSYVGNYSDKYEGQGYVDVGTLQTAVSTVDAAISSAQSTQQLDLIVLQDLINKPQETMTQLTNTVKGEHDSSSEIARNMG